MIWVWVQCGKVSQERWESHLIFLNNSTCPLQLAAAGLAAHFLMLQIQERVCCVPAAFERPWRESSPVTSSQNLVGVKVSAASSLTPLRFDARRFISALSGERERERDVEDWESLEELSMLAFKIEINKNNGKVYGIYAVSFALEIITIVICISKWESSSFTLEVKKKKEGLMETLQSLAVFSSPVSDFFFVLECLEQRDSLLSLPVTAG